MFNKNFIVDNVKTLFYALIIAIIIRSLFIQPFYIPSSSMEPTLLVGDRIFVIKYVYGYSKHSFPFSPNIFLGRILFSEPKAGDVVVFKTPADNRTDYIKRLIGLPGDEIQFINGDLYINSFGGFKGLISDFLYCSEAISANDMYKLYISGHNAFIIYNHFNFVVPKLKIKSKVLVIISLSKSTNKRND